MPIKKDHQIKSKRAKKKMKILEEMNKSQEEVIDYGMNNETNRNMLIPSKLESKSTKLRTNEYQDSGVVLKNPFSLLTIGPSGSGKSTCINYMLLNMYKDFFDEIYLLSPTAETDDIVKHLKLKKKNIFSKNLEENMEKIIRERKQLCERKGGPQNCGTCLVYLDDCSGVKQLNNSRALIDCFVLLRHYGTSVIYNGHKIRQTVHPIIRMNTRGVIAFPASNQEKEAIVEQWSPPNLTKQEFGELINYAWTPDDDFPRPFLFIKLDEGYKTMFRKGFHQILKLNK